MPENSYYEPLPRKPKRQYPMERRDFLFSLFALVVCIAFVFLALSGRFMIGFTVGYVALFILISVYLADKETRLRPFPVCCGILALAGSITFLLQENVGIKIFLLLWIFALTAIWFYSLRNRTLPAQDGALISLLFSSTVAESLCGAEAATRGLFCHADGKPRNLGKALLGILCSIPVLSLVLPLLISSDAAFSGMVDQLLTRLVSTVLQLLLGVAFAYLVTSYGFAHRKGATQTKATAPSTAAGLDPVLVSTFLGMLSVCYLAYLFSQLAYFFSGFSGILPQDYSAADYARRGFFELCAISVINLGVLIATLTLSKRNARGRLCLASQILSVFICLFTMVILATALSKMVMYISRFGMTRLRLTTSAFMVFLAVVLLALLLKHFIPKIPVAKVGLIAGACVLLVLGLGNVNRVVAAYNIQAYRAGVLEELDVYTIGTLGVESVPYLMELSQDADPSIAKQAKDRLLCQVRSMYDLRDDVFVRPHAPLGKWTLPRHQAYEILDKYVEDNPDLPQKWHDRFKNN